MNFATWQKVIIKCDLNHLEYELDIVNCILSVEYRKGKKNDFTVKRSGKYQLNQVTKVNIISNNLCWYNDMTWCERHLILCCYFLKSYPQPNHEKNITQPKLKNILQNAWPLLLKIVKVIKNKERLRNPHRLKVIRRPVDYMQCNILDWILKQKKNINGKTDRIWIKSVV